MKIVVAVTLIYFSGVMAEHYLLTRKKNTDILLLLGSFAGFMAGNLMLL